MEINIGYDFINKSIIKNENGINNTDEEKILKEIIIKLSGTYNKQLFNIKNNTNDYLTLKYKEYDIVRVKYTEKSKWISIIVLGNVKDENIDNPLFDLQKNKNQLLWKSELVGKNIDVYIPILIDTIKLLK